MTLPLALCLSLPVLPLMCSFLLPPFLSRFSPEVNHLLSISELQASELHTVRTHINQCDQGGQSKNMALTTKVTNKAVCVVCLFVQCHYCRQAAASFVC